MSLNNKITVIKQHLKYFPVGLIVVVLTLFCMIPFEPQAHSAVVILSDDRDYDFLPH